MKICVLLKQVPDTDNVKLDPETGTMIREGLGSIINPLDLHALEEALKFKRDYEAHITVITMGPPSAEEALKEALAMGADRIILATDRKFAGADSWSTSKVLSEVVRQTDNFDLILAGEKATDGETGQVGPEVAAMLDIPFSTYVSQIEKLEEKKIRVKRTVEDGYEYQRLPFPCLVTVLGDINQPSMPTLSGKKSARRACVERVSSAQTCINEEYLGLKGSPTRVAKIATPQLMRESKKYTGSKIDDGICELMKKLKEMAII